MNITIRRPKIDKSRIVKDFWEIDAVILAERWLQDQFMQPGYFDKTCVHEGAHLYYARQIYPDAKICPPSIAFFEGKVWPIGAAIDTNGINKHCDRNRLLTFVKGLQAGGVATALHLAKLFPGRELSEILTETCDEDDRKNYPQHCDDIRDASPGLEFDNEAIWIDALKDLMADLSTPEIKTAIDVTTKEVRAFLLAAMFPGTSSSASLNDDSSIHLRS